MSTTTKKAAATKAVVDETPEAPATKAPRKAGAAKKAPARQTKPKPFSFSAERAALQAAVTMATKAVGSAGSMPALACLHLEVKGNQLTVAGTNLDTAITSRIEVNGGGDGAVLVPARLLGEIVRKCPEVVAVASVGDNLRVKSGEFRADLHTLPEADWPEWGRTAESEGKPTTHDAVLLAAAMSKAVVSASSDAARPILTGVLFTPMGKELRLVSTDSYRLGVYDVHVPNLGVLANVGAQAVRYVLGCMAPGIDTLEVHADASSVSFVVGAHTVRTRRIEGDYPNYVNLLPASMPSSARVNRLALLAAVERTATVLEKGAAIRCEVKDGKLVLAAASDTTGRAGQPVDATIEGEDMLIGFNPQYLADGLRALPDDEVVMSYTDGLKPVIFRNAGTMDDTYLLMPVRVPPAQSDAKPAAAKSA
jgi:DNA polymerase-3 subunit beta